MVDRLRKFESIARKTAKPSAMKILEFEETIHPFDQRNIHPNITGVSQKLFDDGHYSQSVFEAFKLLEGSVKKLSEVTGKTGHALMMKALNEEEPIIQLTNLVNESEVDEQKGYKHILAGAMSAIRNPRGHVAGHNDTVEQCLDYLGFASMLLRRINARISP